MAGTSAENRPIIVFTDGAASGNPGPGGWGVVIVTPGGHVTELGGSSPHTTNNRMELTAAIAGLERVAGAPDPAEIYTDSSYVVQGITQWVWNWRRRGWKTAEGADVLNRELWEQLFALASMRGTDRLTWRWVRGHDGTPGNERVDRIAVAFSRGRTETLYDGPLAGYGSPILDLPSDTALPARSSSRSGAARPPKGGSATYLSLVDGVLERHPTWSECERRVKGRSGARFKKAVSAADEAAILKAWGLGSPR